jgi:D-tyrosyl-tRNA(Tyr) deacylase
VRALVQRVTRASVAVDGETIAAISAGFLVLLGVTHSDDIACAERLADRVRALRIFPGADGRMNEPLGDRDVLCVSQFTLYADTRRGTRPGFSDAAEPEQARVLYEHFCDRLDAARGRFGARMAVELVNDGPVTVMLDTAAVAGG